jgi:hypothetical protein
MKQNNNIQPFENLLMAYITKGNQQFFVSSTVDKEAEIVFSNQYTASLPKEKADALLGSLAQSLAMDTLGTLVEKELATVKPSLSELQQKTGLTPSLLEAIKTDMVFTNSIPVRSLVKLLKFLGVNIEKAQAAIGKTYEKLSTESKMFLSVPAHTQPSFRKGSAGVDMGIDVMRLKSDESYLYQNKEALDKYTKRLGELYNEI